jgi:5-(carboxyamino)imidazole ribonucleotide synthase
VAVVADEAAATAFAGARTVVAEPLLPLERELAVLVARRPGGEAVVYPPVQTVQVDGICHELVAPAPVGADLADAAAALALRVAELCGAVGILAVELFVVDGRLLVNEVAPRPHNSGHHTIEHAATSQFENHLRAVLDWPLGATTPRTPAAAMVNVLGSGDTDPRDRLPAALALGPASVHLYAKGPRAGRKLGHVTALGDDPAEVRDRARRVAAALSGAA